MPLSRRDALIIAASADAPLAARQAAFLTLLALQGRPLDLDGDRLCLRPLRLVRDPRPPRVARDDRPAILRVIDRLRAGFALSDPDGAA